MDYDFVLTSPKSGGGHGSVLTQTFASELKCREHLRDHSLGARVDPFHFAFGCQDRADLLHQLRAALEAPPARTDEELFRWLMSTARVGRPAHVFYEHLVRCRARRNASDAANA